MFHLSATSQVESGDWTGNTTVRDAGENEAAVDGRTTEELSLEVLPPDKATTEETATLTVRAEVPAPNDRTVEETIQLPIEEAAGTPISHFIRQKNLVVLSRDRTTQYAPPPDPTQETVNFYDAMGEVFRVIPREHVRDQNTIDVELRVSNTEEEPRRLDLRVKTVLSPSHVGRGFSAWVYGGSGRTGCPGAEGNTDAGGKAD